MMSWVPVQKNDQLHVQFCCEMVADWNNRFQCVFSLLQSMCSKVIDWECKVMTCDNAAGASRLVVCIDPPNQNPHELSLSREVTKPLVAHHKVSSYPSILTNADGSVTFCQQNKTDIISSDGLMIQQTALWGRVSDARTMHDAAPLLLLHFIEIL
jgi:hypothetical protein